MPPRDSIILLDAVAIKGAHHHGCWNALRKAYQLHSVQMCIEEATRRDKKGRQLVARTEAELGAELTVGSVTPVMRTQLVYRLGNRIDLDAGERDLLAYALTIGARIWWLCGPDNGSVNALHALGMLDRMVSLQGLARGAGQKVDGMPFHYTDQWLSDRRTKFLLDDPSGP